MNLEKLHNHDLGLLIFRLSIGILMLLHGIDKLFKGVDSIAAMLANAGLPAVFAYGVYIGEVLAPIAIIIGFRTRIVATILAFNMVVAALLAHPESLFALNQFGGWALELIGLYLFGSIALIFTGAGKYALSTKHPLD